jgi:hypothetical protein
VSSILLEQNWTLLNVYNTRELVGGGALTSRFTLPSRNSSPFIIIPNEIEYGSRISSFLTIQASGKHHEAKFLGLYGFSDAHRRVLTNGWRSRRGASHLPHSCPQRPDRRRLLHYPKSASFSQSSSFFSQSEPQAMARTCLTGC